MQLSARLVNNYDIICSLEKGEWKNFTFCFFSAFCNQRIINNWMWSLSATRELEMNQEFTDQFALQPGCWNGTWLVCEENLFDYGNQLFVRWKITTWHSNFNAVIKMHNDLR